MQKITGFHLLQETKFEKIARCLAPDCAAGFVTALNTYIVSAEASYW